VGYGVFGAWENLAFFPPFSHQVCLVLCVCGFVVVGKGMLMIGMVDGWTDGSRGLVHVVVVLLYSAVFLF